MSRNGNSRDKLSADYKHILLSIMLTSNQKKVFAALCREPTDFPGYAENADKNGLTSGGVKFALKKYGRRKQWLISNQ